MRDMQRVTANVPQELLHAQRQCFIVPMLALFQRLSIPTWWMTGFAVGDRRRRDCWVVVVVAAILHLDLRRVVAASVLRKGTTLDC